MALRAAVFAAVAAWGLAAIPSAHARAEGLTLWGAWIRLVIPSRPAAGYFILRNGSDRARSLIGASSPACGRLMLHRSATHNGADEMVRVDKVPVPAHARVQFAPRGYHLMCMQPSAELKPGQQVTVRLHFADGTTLAQPFKVRGATGD